MAEELGYKLDEGSGATVAGAAVERIMGDEYVQHLVYLINSGRFEEPSAIVSLHEELFEQMNALVTDEDTQAAYWA